MDTTIVTALAGIVGSLCGGSASFATAWVTHKTRAKREGVRAELTSEKRFTANSSTNARRVLWIHSSEISTSRKRLLSIYALLNRIRLCASDAVLTQAVELVRFIMEQYFSPNVSIEEFHQRVHDGHIDPLKAFSEACRRELISMHAQV